MEENNKLFVGGDLSGIQKYLYNISSHKAAVSLKGRSAKLCDYMNVWCKKIESAATKAGAKKVAPIYCSGGKFYIIIDISENRETIINAIDQQAKGIKENLWKEQMGQLGINIAYVPFTENTDGTVNVDNKTNQNCGELWKIVNAKFVVQKNQKFKDMLIKQFNEFFEPMAVGGKPKVCAITGIESNDCVPLYKDKPIDGKENFYVLPVVKEQIKCGEDMKNKEKFNTFDEYADGTEFGVLRMDVDGLGKRFIKGFKSIEEYRKYSNSLTDFFEKHIKKLQETNNFKNYLNIIYAGGDDLFIVGRWDKVIDFAELIHKEVENAPFNINIEEDDKIHISGGIAIVKSTFPIAKAADLAGEAEYFAKQFDGEGNGYGKKNSFHMLGKTLSWAEPKFKNGLTSQESNIELSEFDYTKWYKDKFITLITKHSLSKSILHQIMLYSSIADRNKTLKEGIPKNYSYLWHLSYYLTRYAKRYEKSTEICKFCYILRDNELRNERKLELIALAARWAELILKDELNNN